MMISFSLLQHGPSTPSRYIGSPLARGNTPARCGRVEQDQVILGKLLGSGGFGCVYVASIRGRTVVVKTYHKRTGNPRALRQSYNCELLAYRLGLKHTNIVSVLGATSLIDFQEGAWILMEFAGERNLQMILNDPREDIDRNKRLGFALQIARGLHYLHSVNVVHLDVKPANIIATPDCRLRLADFGCCHHISPACEVQEDRKQEVDSGSEPGPWKNDLEGTLAYRAPELLKGDPPSHRADIYSLGITLWQMRTRRGPYEGLPPHAVVFQVVAQHLRPRRPSTDNDDPFELIFRDLYMQCWSASVEERPSSLEVVHAVGRWLEKHCAE